MMSDKEARGINALLFGGIFLLFSAIKNYDYSSFLLTKKLTVWRGTPLGCN